MLIPTQTGCTSTQPTYDEHNRIVRFHREFDPDKTLTLLQVIDATASTAYGIPTAANGSDASKLMQLAKFGNTISSLSRQNRGSPTAQVQFEPAPYGYEELGNRVNEAIENPRIYMSYLGLDPSGEMPEEVKRLQQLVGEWEVTGTLKPIIGKTTKIKGTGRTISIEGGWLITSAPPEEKIRCAQNEIVIRSSSIMGWSPRDGLYHTLQISKRYHGGVGNPIVSFGEITHHYDPSSNIWTAEAQKITGDNAYIKGTSTTKIEGDNGFTETKSNFGTLKSTGKRIKN